MVVYNRTASGGWSSSSTGQSPSSLGYSGARSSSSAPSASQAAGGASSQSSAVASTGSKSYTYTKPDGSKGTTTDYRHSDAAKAADAANRSSSSTTTSGSSTSSSSSGSKSSGSSSSSSGNKYTGSVSISGGNGISSNISIEGSNTSSGSSSSSGSVKIIDGGRSAITSDGKTVSKSDSGWVINDGSSDSGKSYTGSDTKYNSESGIDSNSSSNSSYDYEREKTSPTHVVVTETPYITEEVSEAAKQSGGNYVIQNPDVIGETLSSEFIGTPSNPIPSKAQNYPFIVNSQTRTVTDNMINPDVLKPSGMEIYQQTLQATSKLPLVGSTAKTIETVTINPKTGEFAPVAPFVYDVTAKRLNEWNEFDGSGKERAEAGMDASLTVGITALTFGAGAVIGTGAKSIPLIKSAAFRGAETAGGLVGFGTLSNIGANNVVTKTTTDLSDKLRKLSSDLIHSGNPEQVVVGTVTAPLLGIASGAVGLVGGLPAAGKGVIDLITGKNEKDVITAAKDTVSGFVEYAANGIQENPLFTAGEFVGFSKSYKGVSKVPGSVTKTVEKKAGIIDERIVNTGDTNTVPPQNPLLSAAISSGAVNAEGMLRIDSTQRVSVSPGKIKTYDNKGTLVKVKNKSGELVAAVGNPHPLSKEGKLDLQHSAVDYPYHTKGQIDKIPFTYGTSSMKGAGTVLGLLDKTGVATANKLASSVVYATIPLSVTTHRGKVISYKMSDKVVTAKDGSTQSAIQYIPTQWSKIYQMRNTGEISHTTETFKESYQGNQGFFPVTAPKKFTTDWNFQNESEFAWTTKDGSDPKFETAKFGGLTTEGNTILKVGSNDSLIKTLNENRKANKDRVKNPAVRSQSESAGLDLRNAQADVVRFFARDVAFRLAETVGKPDIKSDTTKHGAEHVEDVAGLAKVLKDLQGDKFSKVSDREIYYAGILHDAAKNTAAENVPGGHGEMVGSVIRSGASLDARSYMKPEAVKEFESILGKEGTERYNNFLRGWDELNDAQKKNVANAVSQHTTNLSLKYSGMMKPLGTARSQTHRLTANKLGMLISDADRITLTERYGAKIRPSKMFADKATYDKAIEIFYGGKSSAIPKANVTSPVLRTGTAAGKSLQQPSVRLASEYGYRKPTVPNRKAVYPGYKPSQREYRVRVPDYKPSQREYRVRVPDYKPSQREYKTGVPNYKVTPNGYSPKPLPGINYITGYAGNGDNYGGGKKGKDILGYSVNGLNKVTIDKKKRDDKRGTDIDYYSAARRGRIDHLSIVDPLEMMGRGSMTNRKRADLTLYKKKLYLVEGEISTKKPNGRRKR